MGCHKGTIEPLGTVANVNLRKLRKQVHTLFDLKWMSEPNKRIARTRAYKNMAAALGIEPDECHVARFDEKLCEQH